MSLKLQNTLLVIGLVIIFATHLYMLIFSLPASQMMGHAILNIIAGICIILSRR